MMRLVGLIIFGCLLNGCATTELSRLQQPEETELIAAGIESFKNRPRSTIRPWSNSLRAPVLEEPAIEGLQTENYGFARSDAPLRRPERTAIAAGLHLFHAVYQATWSRADGPTCNFRPTCSGFALGAIDEMGVRGGFAAFARLQRAHFEDPLYRRQGVHPHDPPANYYFHRGSYQGWEDEADRSHAWYLFVKTYRK